MEMLLKNLELNENKNVFVEGYASANVKDLDGDIITEEALQQAAKELTQEPYNKVFINHDIRDIPIGKIVAAEVRDGKLWVRLMLNKAHPQFETIYNSLKDGFLDAFSIGFRVLERRGNKITRLKILEVSIVGVPANPEAVVENVYEKGAKLIEEMETKGVVPGHPFKYGKDEQSAWKKPTLRDFTNKSWDELSDEEKRRIAGHFAWSPKMPPERFSDLKLPHHDPKTHNVVWRGVVAAMAALFGARGGVDIPSEDRKKVYNHLAKHYREFDREPPEFKTLEEFAREFLEPDFEDLKSPEPQEEAGDSMTEELERLKKENEELRRKVAEYEQREKERLIDKVIFAETKLYGKIDKEKRTEELKNKTVVELKDLYLDVLEKLAEKQEKQVTGKVEVPLEDSEYIETKWGKADKKTLEELRKMVGLTGD